MSILSLVLINVDYLSGWLEQPRSTLTLLLTPVVLAADLPRRGVNSLTSFFSSKEDTRERILSLENTVENLQIKSRKMEALLAENKKLRDLLDATIRLDYKVRVAEVIGVNPDPERQVVVIDQGAEDGVFVGQAILDSSGVMGQVIAVSGYSSQVLLISDQNHSIPVQLLRNDLRLIAQGTGIDQQLELRDVKYTADIHVGDLLFSSGLGDRFPVGYSVGVVEQVVFEPRKSFIRVIVKPTAKLHRSRWMLLVLNEDKRAKVSAKSDAGNDSNE